MYVVDVIHGRNDLTTCKKICTNSSRRVVYRKEGKSIHNTIQQPKIGIYLYAFS